MLGSFVNDYLDYLMQQGFVTTPLIEDLLNVQGSRFRSRRLEGPSRANPSGLRAEFLHWR